jgi:hypothetical protein
VEGMAFSSHKELLAVIGAVVSDIPREILHGVFKRWMERLKWVS